MSRGGGQTWGRLVLVGAACSVAASPAGADLKEVAVASKKACDGGSMPACFKLGVSYEAGQGVPKDTVRAVALFRQACDGGWIHGCAKLGMAYKTGEGVPKDAVRGVALLKQACDGGSIPSCAILALTYLNGLDVPRDEVQGIAFYTRACEGGSMRACVDLGTAYGEGRGVAADDVRSAALYKQACDGGDLLGCTKLGLSYVQGEGVAKDEVRAAALIKQACEGGFEDACSIHGFGPAPPGPVRVGGEIKEPRKLKHVPPEYPDAAKQAGVHGVVILECTIGPQGRVTDATVLRGFQLLNAAAVAAVKEWVYEPTLVNGVPVTVIMTVTVKFDLGVQKQ